MVCCARSLHVLRYCPACSCMARPTFSLADETETKEEAVYLPGSRFFHERCSIDRICGCGLRHCTQILLFALWRGAFHGFWLTLSLQDLEAEIRPPKIGPRAARIGHRVKTERIGRPAGALVSRCYSLRVVLRSSRGVGLFP